MIVCWKAWPMCSVPVTFGGGSRMQYGVPSPCGEKMPAVSQREYHLDSRGLGSKLFSIAICSLPLLARATQSAPFFARHSRAGGNPVLVFRRLANDLCVQITPLRIRRFDQIQFPIAPPLLDRLLAGNRRIHRFVLLEPYERMHVILVRESFNNIIPVLPDS